MSQANKLLNRRVIKKHKVFCIGLHKTGTSTLADFAYRFGYRTNHATDWSHDVNKIQNFDFFSDGGSHFNGQNEFNYEYLFEAYPNAKFILQTRNTSEWIFSKLKHAGWHSKTLIEPDNANKLFHSEWKYKSLLTIEQFLKHKKNYEQKVKDFFIKHGSERFICVEITDQQKREVDTKRIINFLEVKSLVTIKLPHSNRVSSKIDLPDQVKEYIKQKLTDSN